MFITPAWAQDAASTVADNSGSPGIVMTIAPLVGIFIIFYVMVIRPQNKRILEHRKMINNLVKGDKVVTGGGLLATVKKLVSEDEVLLELNAGVEVVAIRSTIMNVRDSAQKREMDKEAREKGEAAVKKLTNQG